MTHRNEKERIFQDLFGYLSKEEDARSRDESDRQRSSYDVDGRPNEGIGRRERQGDAGLESQGKPGEVNYFCKGNKSKHPSSPEVCSGYQRENEGSRSPGDRSHIDAVIRDIFGDSDNEEHAENAIQNQIEDGEKNSLAEKEREFEEDLSHEDIARNGVPYKSAEEHAETQHEEHHDLSLVLEIPSHRPLAGPHEIKMIKLSNIVGIDPKPFDPSTYVEKDYFVTNESAAWRHIPLKHVIRWRVNNPDGSASAETNSRFVEWEDGSWQLFIGDEAFDVTEQDMHDIHAHLFSIHDKGTLQCEGRIRKKMQFMPYSLNSDSHRTLSALVDERDKKVTKVGSCFPEIFPEREIHNKKKAEKEQKMMEANKKHGRKKRAMNHKHKRTVKQEQHQLRTNFPGNAIEKGMKQDICQPQQFDVERHFKENPEKRAEMEIQYFSAKASTHQMKPSSALHGVTFQAPKSFLQFVHPAASSSEPPMRKDSNNKVKGKECEISPPDRKSGETKHICDEEEASEDSGVKCEVNDNFSKTRFF